MPTEEEIKQICDLREQGLDLDEIGKRMGGKHASTISRWFKARGIDCNALLQPSLQQLQTKKAVDTKRIFDRERRLALNNLWFEKIETMLIDAKDANTLRALATPYGVAEDKRHLLEPMQTDNTKSGLEEMREELNDVEETPKDVSSS